MLRVTHLNFGRTSKQLCRHLGELSREVNNASFYKASSFQFQFNKKDNYKEDGEFQRRKGVRPRAEQISDEEPKRLDEVHLKHFKVCDTTHENLWKDFPRFINPRETERKMKEKAVSTPLVKNFSNDKSKVIVKVPMMSPANVRTAQNCVGSSSLVAAAKLAKAKSNLATTGSASSAASTYAKEVEKTHYDEKVSVKKPLSGVADSNFNKVTAEEEDNDMKSERLDDTHLTYHDDEAKAATLADYYSDLVNHGKLADIRIHSKGYSEKSFSWYARQRPPKPTISDMNNAQKSGASSSQPKRSYEIIMQRPKY